MNFNAAVHHALRDLLPLLSAYEHELENLRAEITAANDARAQAQRIEFEQNQSALASLRAELAALRADRNALRTELAALGTELAGLRAELAESHTEVAHHRAETVAALQAQVDLTNTQNARVATQLRDLIAIRT